MKNFTQKILFLSVLTVASLPAFSQTTPTVFDNIGDEVIGQIRNIENSFSIQVNDVTANFPEYEHALGNALNKVENSVIRFQKAIDEDKKLLEDQAGKEVSEYNAIKALLDKSPQNVAYQKLLADKKERLEISMNAAQARFQQNYIKYVRALIHTFPTDRIVFNLKYKEELTSRWDDQNYSIYHLLNVTGESLDKVAGFQNYDSKTRKKYFENFNKKELKKDVLEMVLTGESFDTFPSSYTTYYGREYKAVNETSSLFDDCSTAGCVYLLNEQIKSWFLSLQKIDMSLVFNKGPINLNIVEKGIPTSPERIKFVLDHLGSVKAKTLPIGVMTNN